MARNEEKHAGRLNRLWLQKLDEEQEKKNPARPGLGSLNSAADVQKWIPSIKKDIDFYLKQSQVTCYPDRQIREFSSKIESLTKEYKAYVRKLKELQPLQGGSVPWTDRPYTRKHKLGSIEKEANPVTASVDNNIESLKKSRTDFSPLTTPLLDNDSEYEQLYGYKGDPSTHSFSDGVEELEVIDSEQDLSPAESPSLEKTDVYRISYEMEKEKPPLMISVNCEVGQNRPLKLRTRDDINHVNEKNNPSASDHGMLICSNESQLKNVLNLPYSDSSDEET